MGGATWRPVGLTVPCRTAFWGACAIHFIGTIPISFTARADLVILFVLLLVIWSVLIEVPVVIDGVGATGDGERRESDEYYSAQKTAKGGCHFISSSWRGAAMG